MTDCPELFITESVLSNEHNTQLPNDFLLAQPHTQWLKNTYNDHLQALCKGSQITGSYLRTTVSKCIALICATSDFM